MAKPKTKDQLLSACKEHFERLLEFVEGLPKDKVVSEFQEGFMNRNIRDVFGHLHHWHLLFIHWHESAQKGLKPITPAEGYKWNELPALNQEILGKCQSIDLTEMQNLLVESYKKVINIISQHSEEELFQKKRYSWTGSTSMAAYIIPNTSGHYKWGLQLIKRGLYPKD